LDLKLELELLKQASWTLLVLFKQYYKLTQLNPQLLKTYLSEVARLLTAELLPRRLEISKDHQDAQKKPIN